MSPKAAPAFIKEEKDWAQALSVTVQVIHRDHQDRAEAEAPRDPQDGKHATHTNDAQKRE